MSQARLLLLEDETNLGATLSERLVRQGFEVSWVRSIAEARTLLTDAARITDVALLDLSLPDGSGYEIAELLRSQSPTTAVVFLSAHADPDHRLQGFELGAQDFVAKPFHFKELVLRIRNLLARSRPLPASASAVAPSSVAVGAARVDLAGLEAERDGKRHPLSSREAALLRFLIERRNQVVSRDAILDRVWGAGEYPTPRTVDNFVVRLRKIVEPNPELPSVIQSIRGVGYRLKSEEHA